MDRRFVRPVGRLPSVDLSAYDGTNDITFQGGLEQYEIDHCERTTCETSLAFVGDDPFYLSHPISSLPYTEFVRRALSGVPIPERFQPWFDENANLFRSDLPSKMC
jgi:hypothetical protein